MKHIKLFENFSLNESPFGPNGYFPPMGADTPKDRNEHTEEIFKGNTAEKVAKALKKALDKINPEMKKVNQVVAPIVNYYPSMNEGTLILGYVFTDLPNHNFRTEGDQARELRRKFDPMLEKILSMGKTQIWSGFHKGINGRYKGIPFKTGIVTSIITPQKQFSNAIAEKLTNIFEQN